MPTSRDEDSVQDSLFGREQPPLFELPRKQVRTTQSLAEVCALEFSREFRRKYEELGRPEKLPEDLELLSLACLLVVSDGQAMPNPKLINSLTVARDCLQTREPWRYLDELPFDLCLEILGSEDHAVNRLVSAFSNGESSIRLWGCGLGWLIRDRLDRAQCVPLLLFNTEFQLGYWVESLALCRHLFSDKAEFWRAVDGYTPTEIADQYFERIAGMRDEEQSIEYPLHFLEMECRVRRRIDSWCLSFDTGRTNLE